MCSKTRTNERTLEVHTAVDITPFLVASWSQRPDKGVIVLYRAPALLWDTSQSHPFFKIRQKKTNSY